jgi:hypothetical protein
LEQLIVDRCPIARIALRTPVVRRNFGARAFRILSSRPPLIYLRDLVHGPRDDEHSLVDEAAEREAAETLGRDRSSVGCLRLDSEAFGHAFDDVNPERPLKRPGPLVLEPGWDLPSFAERDPPLEAFELAGDGGKETRARIDLPALLRPLRAELEQRAGGLELETSLN